ncbi:MAG: nickel-dependent lactate racemase [Caldilineales bacterium]|nr:nickel-dependent lactate racemase [Caldilineales bacterium]
MQVELAYGRTGLTVELPDSADVIRAAFEPGLADERQAILAALREPIGSPPLRELISAGDSVVIVHTDITRATPNERMLPVLLTELESNGIRREDITLLNGLGTHRRQTDAELRMMLGDEVVDNYRCLQHSCFDEEELVALGVTSLGHPVRVNRRYLEADVKILTGFIEPHFFAGFSGGPKAVLPSLAGKESVFSNHGRDMIGHPQATWGVIEGNPIWEEMREAALMTNPTFLLNVTLNNRKAITGVFAGDMLAAHRQGCEFVRASSMAGVDAPYDIVITTNSGYPLDQNLYQAVKGMSAASQIVREGGVIIAVAACADGLPDHGQYAELLRRGGSPQGVLDMLAQSGFVAHDQWQAQIQARIQLRAEVFVYSDGLSDEQIHGALFTPCRDIEQTIAELQMRFGPNARICVLPDGPLTIPYLRRDFAVT